MTKTTECVFVIYRASVCYHNTDIASTSCWNADYNVPHIDENILAIINQASSFILLVPLFQLDIIKLIIMKE